MAKTIDFISILWQNNSFFGNLMAKAIIVIAISWRFQLLGEKIDLVYVEIKKRFQWNLSAILL